MKLNLSNSVRSGSVGTAPQRAPANRTVSYNSPKHLKRDIAVLAAAESPTFLTQETDLSIHKVSYEDGTYSIVGKLVTPYCPDIAYSVLTDYNSLPNIFHNVEECTVQWSEDGGKHLVQSCSWRFLVFRGTFITELTVAEREAVRQLEFSLRKSSFMRKFVGSWDIKTGPMGGSEIWHSLSVQPALAPPKKIGDLTKKIFVSQVEGILGDLAAELQRRSVDLEST